MQRKPSAQVGTLGVTYIKLAVEEELGWLFREQPTEDYGIDAHTEVVDGTDVRGKLLALQIKSGVRHFREATPDGWWFRPRENHVAYWLGHSLPVEIILFHPSTKRCYWQLANRQTLEKASTGGWKVLVPKHQILDSTAANVLREAAQGDPYMLRIRELRLAKPWMEMLLRGLRLVVEIEEWINKTDGRGLISLGIDNEDGQKPVMLATWGVRLGSASYEAMSLSLS